MKQPNKQFIDKVVAMKTSDKLTKRDIEIVSVFMEIAKTAEKNREAAEVLKREYEPFLKSFREETRDKWNREYRALVTDEKYREKGYMLRWDYETCLTKPSPVNEGKAITNSNHMYNILDQEEMDISYENEPIYGDPKVLGPSLLAGYVMPNIEEATGDFYKYSLGILKDKIRMQQEIQMNHEIPVAPEREEDMAELKTQIRERAHELGFGVVGFTKVDRRFIGEGDDHVAPYQNIVILGLEMVYDELEEVPHPGKNTKEQYVMKAYANAGEGATLLAEFIRSKGWKAHPRVSMDGEVKYIHHAVNAGVANFGTAGNTITKEYGPRVRYAAVIFEGDIEPDSPKDFNVEEFCSRCRMCQKVCPTKAIPKEAVRIRGAMRRRLNDKKCFSSMVGMNHECGMCLKVCPFHKFGFHQAMDAIPSYYSYNLD